MQDNNLYKLLVDVKQIIDRDYIESFKQGKEFNIFYVQGIASDEVRVCRLIRELLDPEGSHGQRALFLRKFIKDVIKTEESFADEDYQNAKVTREERTAEARRIDIVIRIGGKLFPIEVKIYAGDQVDQCFDYYEYAKTIDANAKVYYLTLDGHDPTAESKREMLYGQYECISFSEEILTWLDDCINSSELEYINPVKEILIQFQNVIRDLTGRQKGKMMSEIKEAITSSPGNMKAAIRISNALPDIRAEKMREVFKSIKDYMQSRGFSASFDDYQQKSVKYYRSGDMTRPAVGYIIPLPGKIVEDRIELRFEIGEYLYCGMPLWFGVYNKTGDVDNEVVKYVSDFLTRVGISVRKDDKDWFWWKYLNEENNINFLREDDGYLALYDKDGFQKYMEGVYSTISAILESIKY